MEEDISPNDREKKKQTSERKWEKRWDESSEGSDNNEDEDMMINGGDKEDKFWSDRNNVILTESAWLVGMLSKPKKIPNFGLEELQEFEMEDQFAEEEDNLHKIFL